MREAQEIRERIGAEIDPQLSKFASKVAPLVSADRQWVRERITAEILGDFVRRAETLTKSLIWDVCFRDSMRFPNRKELMKIYAAALRIGYLDYGEITEEKICHAFNISRPTLEAWVEVIGHYDLAASGYMA